MFRILIPIAVLAGIAAFLLGGPVAAAITVPVFLLGGLWNTKRRCKAALKKVLQLYLDRRNDAGGWLDAKEIEQATGLSARRVVQVLFGMHESGWIELKRSPNSFNPIMELPHLRPTRLMYNKVEAARDMIAA